MKKVCRTALQVSVILLVTLGLLEGGVALLLRSSKLLASPYVPWQLGTFAEKYYQRKDRSIIQYLPECAQYDSELFYVNRPGSCSIQSREFDITYAFNDLGLRGETLKSPPSIVVLGDSEAMGWGVRRDESFTGLIETALQKPIANVAVSSYGTAREMLLLRRLNLPNQTLIIAYNANDEPENAAFVADGGQLHSRAQEEYQAIVDQEIAKQHYVPGRHLLNLLDWVMTTLLSPKPSAGQVKQPPQPLAPAVTGEEQEARLFLQTLAYFPDVLRDKRVLVIQINESYNANNGLFIKALKKFITAGMAKDIPCRLEPVDLQPVLRPEFFYFFDGHINAQGHAAVTQVLLERLGN